MPNLGAVYDVNAEFGESQAALCESSGKTCAIAVLFDGVVISAYPKPTFSSYKRRRSSDQTIARHLRFVLSYSCLLSVKD